MGSEGEESYVLYSRICPRLLLSYLVENNNLGQTTEHLRKCGWALRKLLLYVRGHCNSRALTLLTFTHRFPS